MDVCKKHIVGVLLLSILAFSFVVSSLPFVSAGSWSTFNNDSGFSDTTPSAYWDESYYNALTGDHLEISEDEYGNGLASSLKVISEGWWREYVGEATYRQGYDAFGEYTAYGDPFDTVALGNSVDIQVEINAKVYDYSGWSYILGEFVNVDVWIMFADDLERFSGDTLYEGVRWMLLRFSVFHNDDVYPAFDTTAIVRDAVGADYLEFHHYYDSWEILEYQQYDTMTWDIDEYFEYAMSSHFGLNPYDVSAGIVGIDFGTRIQIFSPIYTYIDGEHRIDIEFNYVRLQKWIN